MKNSKIKQYFLILSLTFSLALFSCRKKDERYEGVYTGTERYFTQDSGATIYSHDTTYYQECDVTYDRKQYTFVKLFNNQSGPFTADKTSIVNHQSGPSGELYYDTEGNFVGGSGYLKFSGDSLYITQSSYFNGDQEEWQFKGKRN